MPFLHTISRKLQFRTATQLQNRSKVTILDRLREVIQLYHARGFAVTELKTDQEFNCLRIDVLPILLDALAVDNNVHNVERSIRTVKGDTRTLTVSLPFSRVPRFMVSEIITFALRSRNMLPAPNGVSKTMSPLSLVTGAPKPEYAHMKLEFGSYVHIFNDNVPTNTMTARTTGAIVLNSVGNSKGDYYFLNLETGKRVIRNQYTPLPIPKDVIEQVNLLGLRDKMPLLQKQCLIFERRHGIPLPDDAVFDEALDHLQFGAEGDDDDYSYSSDGSSTVSDDDSILSLSTVEDEEREESNAPNDIDNIAADPNDSDTIADDPNDIDPPAFSASDSSIASSIDNSTTSLAAPAVPSTASDVSVPSFESTLPIADADNSATTSIDSPPSDSERGANSERGENQTNHTVEPVPTPNIERGATSTATHTHNLRDRSTIGDRVTFNDEIDNPVSSKSYSSQHLSFSSKVSTTCTQTVNILTLT